MQYIYLIVLFVSSSFCIYCEDELKPLFDSGVDAQDYFDADSILIIPINKPIILLLKNKNRDDISNIQNIIPYESYQYIRGISFYNCNIKSINFGVFHPSSFNVQLPINYIEFDRCNFIQNFSNFKNDDSFVTIVFKNCILDSLPIGLNKDMLLRLGLFNCEIKDYSNVVNMKNILVSLAITDTSMIKFPDQFYSLNNLRRFVFATKKLYFNDKFFPDFCWYKNYVITDNNYDSLKYAPFKVIYENYTPKFKFSIFNDNYHSLIYEKLTKRVTLSTETYYLKLIDNTRVGDFYIYIKKSNNEVVDLVKLENGIFKLELNEIYKKEKELNLIIRYKDDEYNILLKCIKCYADEWLERKKNKK